MQTSAHAAEIRQQLALLQAEIQSMQPQQGLVTNPNHIPPTYQNVANNAPATSALAMSIPPALTFVTSKTADPKSPLSKGIQTSPWPVTYKPITLPKYNGKSDPRQFIMSFEAAIASARGNDSVLAKSFIIAAEGDALASYSMLKPSTIYSWENLQDKILENFKGFSSESLTSIDLFQCKQSQGEPLKDYFQRYVQLKARASNVSDDVAIEAAIKGIRIGPFAAHLAREKPATMQQLYSELNKYYKSDADYRKRLEEQNQGRHHGGRNGRRNGNGQGQQQQRSGQGQQVFNIEHQVTN
jgi:hypothetical protein